MFKSLYLKLLIGIISLVPLVGIGSSDVFDLEIFTSNGEYWSSGGNGYRVEVVESGGREASLIFSNWGSIDSVIGSIYFADDIGIIDWVELGGDRFVMDEVVRVLPAWRELEPDFITTESFRATPPPSLNGIGTGETYTITLGLGQSYNEFLQSISNSQFNVGIHIISFPDGSSESAVIRVVPEPSTIVMGIIALGIFFIIKSIIKHYERKK